MGRTRAWAIALALLAAGCSAGPVAAPVSSAPSSSPPPPESFTLVATGDVLVHQDRALTAGAEQPDGSYDFSAVFAPVAPLIEAADLAICHLETPVAPRGGPYRGYPSFAVQPEIVDALVGAGYDACTTASNHSLDDGTAGLVRTLDTLDAAGIAHAGTYRSEAESLEPTLVDAGGVTVGLVAGTFGLNGVPLPTGREWSVDVAPAPDVDGVLAAASRARTAGAEVVVASLHCCVEYRHDPTDDQVDAATALLASPDVDLVLGHHAHVVQPIEAVAGSGWPTGSATTSRSTRPAATRRRTRCWPASPSPVARTAGSP
ncbi:CapA family protein [Blastococcus brunescens]|uniref:CapA family protein n=1 Tax=Blastococcus brunescens TaxID=1564165 RepID=A0ABZ1B8M1_9ACTN|nr:CapA family protein [Blastococcus sp. BMG 8361]WRL66168.1 CapA family protein [Blastococcus sp. BMG 8361]